MVNTPGAPAGAPPSLFDAVPLGERWAVTAGPLDLGVVVAVFGSRPDAAACARDLNRVLEWHVFLQRIGDPTP